MAIVCDEKLVVLFAGSDFVTEGGVTSFGPPVGVTMFAQENANIEMKRNMPLTNLFFNC